MITPVEMFCSRVKGLSAPSAKGNRKSEHITTNVDEPCILCGGVYAEGLLLREGGEIRHFPEIKESFNDMGSVNKDGRFLCDLCRRVMSKTSMSLIGNMLITRDRVLKFSATPKEGLPEAIEQHTPDIIPSLMLNPPEPPFAWVFKTFRSMRPIKESEHLLWRARVSLSRDVFFVQSASDTLLIDRRELESVLGRVRALLTQEPLVGLQKKESVKFRILFGEAKFFPKLLRDYSGFWDTWLEFRNTLNPEIYKLLTRVYPNIWANSFNEPGEVQDATEEEVE